MPGFYVPRPVPHESVALHITWPVVNLVFGIARPCQV
jgi:hypothetical protein